MNLLEETTERMVCKGQSPLTIAWVGDRDGRFSGSWADFVAVADFDYDAGYGGQEIHEDLVVVFQDGSWFERSEYDGNERWHYRMAPVCGAEPLISKTQLEQH